MKLKLNAILFTLSLIISLSVSAVPISPLPNLELMGSDEKKHHLNEFIGKGKWTVVIVWGPKCPACIEEMPEIQGLYDDTKTNNIDVLGLVLDFPSFGYADIKQVQHFEEDYFITFPNLLISSNIYDGLKLGRLKGTPTTILISPKGLPLALQLGGVPRKVIEKFIADENKKLSTKK